MIPQYEVSSSRDSSFDVLYSDDDIKGDRAADSMTPYSHVVGASTSPTLSASEMRTAILKRERAIDYIQVYLKT